MCGCKGFLTAPGIFIRYSVTLLIRTGAKPDFFWEKTLMKKPIAALAASVAALALGAGVASAASLVAAKKYEYDVEKGTAEAERKEFWEKFGGWCAIKDWHPAIASCEESKDGDDSFRTLTLEGGGVIKEQLLATGATMYRYRILESPLPVKNYEAMFQVMPEGDDLDGVKMTWSATFDPADGKEAKEARDTINGIFQAGVDSIKEIYGRDEGDDDDD